MSSAICCWRSLCLTWRARRILLHVWLGGQQPELRVVWARFILDGRLRDADGRLLYPRPSDRRGHVPPRPVPRTDRIRRRP